MLKPLLMLLLGGASTACALAAVGWSLYAQHAQATWVAQCFAAWGFLAGLGCGALQWGAQGRPVPAPAALPPEALAGMVRATLAKAAAERQARPGSAADRRPAAGADRPAAPAPAAAVPTSTVAAVAAVAAVSAVRAAEQAQEVATP